MDSTSTVSHKQLRLGVIMNIFLVACGIAGSLPVIALLVLPMYPIILGFGLAGAYLGVSATFRERGFNRLIALLSGLVSVCAVIRSAGFLGWMNIP
jgi:hypothetical protein